MQPFSDQLAETKARHGMWLSIEAIFSIQLNSRTAVLFLSSNVYVYYTVHYMCTIYICVEYIIIYALIALHHFFLICLQSIATLLSVSQWMLVNQETKRNGEKKRNGSHTMDNIV